MTDNAVPTGPIPAAPATPPKRRQSTTASARPNQLLFIAWLVFWAVLIFDSGEIAGFWDTFRDWPLLAQLVVGLLLLPVVAATWVWQTDWSLWARLAVVLLLFAVSTAAFSPRPRPWDGGNGR